jgi:hypothetical protein
MKFAITMLAVGSLGLVACAGTTGDAKSPADAEKTALNSGTKVCISDLVGVRYTLEDVLRQQNLEPTGSCTSAKVRLQEAGTPKSWIMRYQRIGDAKWKECKSSEQERSAFAEQCVGQMKTDLGG